MLVKVLQGKVLVCTKPSQTPVPLGVADSQPLCLKQVASEKAEYAVIVRSTKHR